MQEALLAILIWPSLCLMPWLLSFSQCWEKVVTEFFKCSGETFAQVSYLRRSERQTQCMWWQKKTEQYCRSTACTWAHSRVKCTKERSQCFLYWTLRMKHRWNTWESCIFFFLFVSVIVKLWDLQRSVSRNNCITVIYFSWRILWCNERYLETILLMEKHWHRTQVSFFSLWQICVNKNYKRYRTNCHLFFFCFQGI